MRGSLNVLSLFCNELMNSIRQETNVRFYLSYDIKITLKSSHFCRINILIVSLCTKRCYGRHNISHKSVNH